MKSLHIITPVKDSIEFTLETVKAILDSEIKFLILIRYIMILVRRRIQKFWRKVQSNWAFG